MKVLLAVDSAIFPGTLLNELCSRHQASIGDLTVVTNLKELATTQSAAGTFDAVVSLSAFAKAHSVQTVGQLLALAKPGASVTLQEPVSSSPTQDVSSPEKLQQQALLGGLTQGAATQAYALLLAPALAGREGVQSAAVEGRKPAWEAGAQQSITRKLGGKAAAASMPATAAAPSPAAMWATINADDAELLDDEELLTEEDLVRPAAPVADSCAVSRKACKNCTCGRAEDEAAGAPPPKLTLDMLENPGSAGGCGSCSLGDAFRCASCPYRGLPSFQPGKKIELPTGFLAADF